MTGFFGGSYDTKAIITFDWETMAYTKHTSRFNGTRKVSACSLLVNENGEKLVAVAGGYSPGLEVWNPEDGTVRTLTPDFPLSSSQGYVQMISVNGDSELIFYEARINSTDPKGIWKYHQTNNTWSKLGEMLFPRDDFAVLPVDGLSCPSN